MQPWPGTPGMIATKLRSLVREEYRKLGGAKPTSAKRKLQVIGGLRLSHEIVDLTEEISSPIGLFNKASVIRNLGATRPCLAGRNYEKHVWPTRMYFPRQIHTVQHSGHLNVGEQQPYVVA